MHCKKIIRMYNSNPYINFAVKIYIPIGINDYLLPSLTNNLAFRHFNRFLERINNHLNNIAFSAHKI